MRLTICAATMLLLITACQKNVSVNEQQQLISANVTASDALTPLACHTTAFTTDYPIKAGQVPPFQFTKTLYADTRVKTIKMLSRRYPIYAAYLNHAIELNATFTYGPNRAYLKGTSQVWEYYRYSDGSLKKHISKKNVNLKFYLTPQGYCNRVTDLDRSQGQPESGELIVLDISFLPTPQLISSIFVQEGPYQQENTFFYPHYDQYGNILTFDRPYNRWAPFLTYTYDYNVPRGSKNYSLIPSQNWISQEYSLLEVMQWLPQSNHQRKTVSASFYPFATNTYPFNTGEKIVQSQTYKNYMFDSKGNQVSVTYGDNVAQKTTWFCQ